MNPIGIFGPSFKPAAGLAGVRTASRRLNDLAGVAAGNSDAILRSLHPPPAATSPAGGGGNAAVAGGGLAAAAAYLASDEGRAALETTLERGWTFLRGLFAGTAVAAEQLPLPFLP